MAISSDFTIHHTFSDFDIDNPITDLAERNFYILKNKLNKFINLFEIKISYLNFLYIV